MFKGTFSKLVVLAMIFAMLNMMIGCNTNGPAQPVDTGSGVSVDRNATTDESVDGAAHSSMALEAAGKSVVLTGAERVPAVPAVAVEYQYLSDENTWVDRFIVISIEDDTIASYTSAVVTPEADTIVSVVVSYGDVRPNTVVITEATPFDTLTIERTVIDDMITETYTQHGATFTIDFTEAEMARYELLREQMDADPWLEMTDGDGTLVRKFKAFENFYDYSSTLENNVEGEIMTGIVTSDEFRDWLGDELGMEQLEYASPNESVAKRLCRLVQYATTLKCAYGGGIANFGCVAGFGISVACFIADVALWIMGDEL